MRWPRRIALILVAGCMFCFVLLSLSLYELYMMEKDHVKFHSQDWAVGRQIMNMRQNPVSKAGPTFSVYGHDSESGYLKHVFNIFDHLGFQRAPMENGSWDVLWAHDYPFTKFFQLLKNLKPHQKVNHFPGNGYITNKMDLASSNIPHIPKAFKLPGQKQDLLNYVKENPKKKFVQKSNDHRGIKIEGIENINLDASGSFVQEYIDKPLLVDGYKFDIGIYTIITSVDPLRVYIYNGDVLFRYCTEKYYPFDQKILEKYVVGDDYRPTWEVEPLKKYYNGLGFSMKDSFDAHLRDQGKDPDKIWSQIEEAIRLVCLNKEPMIINILRKYVSKRNFFEMVRFDFVVDEDLNVFIMEANMSPNLSSAHFPPNRLLYEQVLFNLFGLVGLDRIVHKSLKPFEVSDKNIVVNPAQCSKCESCVSPVCLMCLNCLSDEYKKVAQDSYLEHVNRRDCKRIFPPTLNPKVLDNQFLDDMSPENKFMYRWFHGKCVLDHSWC